MVSEAKKEARESPAEALAKAFTVKPQTKVEPEPTPSLESPE